MQNEKRDHLHKNGWLHLKSVVSKETLTEMMAAVKRLEEEFPHGFTHNDYYSQTTGVPRTSAPKPTDFTATIIHPNVGFREPVLLAPLVNPEIHEFIESVVGRDYYLSNIWMQGTPPGTGRMGFHKDPRGSLSFTFLLDSIGPKTGGTVLVPGSQLHSPPAAFGLDDINKPHPDEVEFCGETGDIVFFSPEAWHARAVNESSQTTYRLFFNFYSRSSKATTSWAKAVTEEQMERVKAALPEKLHRMFDLDPEFTARLQADAFTPAELQDGAKSFNQYRADIAHSRRTYGKSSFHPKHPGYLLPYTTRLTEDHKFSTLKYVANTKPVPMVKSILRSVRDKLLSKKA